MAETELQLNKSVSGYARIPYSIFKLPLYPNGGRKPRRSEILILSTIFSFSDEKAPTPTRCEMSYRTFGNKLGLSHGAVARAINELKTANKINQDKSRRSCASYACINPPKESGFIKTEFYLFATQFHIRAKIVNGVIREQETTRFLTTAEINVLCLIKTHCSNQKHAELFIGSVRGIASTLNLSKTTVQKCIDTLLRADLIYRTAENRGVNGHKRSDYTVNEKLLRRTEKNHKKATAPAASDKQPTSQLSQAEQAANARADRESYYARLQSTAHSRVEAFRERLNADDTYRRVNAALRAVEPRIARAEVFTLPELEGLQREKRKLSAQRAKRMAELNISEADLQPIWKCPKCSDTGFRPNGRMCDCYPGGRQQP